jgi:hypothetical protein
MTVDDRFAELARTCESSVVDAMLDALVASLAERKRWHALFDARIIQARVAVGLPPVGMPGDVPADRRDAFDARSLAACREAGWPLLDGGQVAAGRMYLRAAVEPAEVATARYTRSPLLRSTRILIRLSLGSSVVGSASATRLNGPSGVATSS